MRAILTGALLVLITACGSVEGCPIAGTYLVSSERDPSVPGDCPADIDDGEPTQIQVSYKEGSGRAELIFSFIGGSCPGDVAGCGFATTCEARSPSGDLQLRVQFDMDFSENGATGFSTLTIFPGVLGDVPGGCTASYLESWTKR
jgi:major membrane immunogen (membrane-anchored lipoprotein)